jgi:signal transduction histidine kinase
MAASLALRDPTDLAVLAQDTAGATVFRSAHWPAQLDVARLAWPPAPPPRPAPPPPDAVAAERPPPPRPGPPPATAVTALAADGQHWHIGLASSDRGRIAVAVDLRAIDAEMRGIRNAFLVALPLALGIIGLGGWFFSARALRPVRKLTAAAQRVTAAGLDQRIAAQGEDREFVELIEVFNGMLERLQRSFEQARRFSADAAHELKTPLTILQGQLERAINAAEPGTTQQKDLNGILDEVRRLTAITRKLLLLSQADAGRLAIRRTTVDLSALLADLVEDTQMLAPGLRVDASIPPGIRIDADGDLLRQVLHNLVSNAVKYNVKDGWIRFAAKASPRWIEIEVANASPGIPPDQRDRIFEHFYRADPAHARQVEGVGLGLALAREIVRAHDGELNCTVGTDDSVRLLIALPANAA